MQKLPRKIAIIICIICFAFITPIVPAEAVIPVVQEEQSAATTGSNTNVTDLDIDPINTEKVKKNVVPDTKNEIKKVIGLFIKTMVIVAFSAVVLYVILLFVKKYYGSSFMPSADEEEYDNLELTTPEDKISALKSFLNRTK